MGGNSIRWSRARKGKTFVLNSLNFEQNVVIILKLCNWQRHIFFLIFPRLSLFLVPCGLVKYVFVCQIKDEEDEEQKLSLYRSLFGGKNLILIIMSSWIARLKLDSYRVHVTFCSVAVILNAASWEGKKGDSTRKRQMTLLSI